MSNTHLKSINDKNSNSMAQILEIRRLIYNHFQSSKECQRCFIPESNADQGKGSKDKVTYPKHAAYYNSMFLIQDTAESLYGHRIKGFSLDPHEAYIEFWGVMQALTIQQEAMCELYEVVSRSKLNTKELKSWQALVVLRNICAGHPAKKDRGGPLVRTFMGRGFGDYSLMWCEKWKEGFGTYHPRVHLGKLVDKYASEAAGVLSKTLDSMMRQWAS